MDKGTRFERFVESKMNFAGKEVSFDSPRIMAVMNVTPDSFYDGGQLYSNNALDLDKALWAAECMAEQGAHFIDIGGESTRPGAQAISLEQERERVLPVVERLARSIDAVISVDTSTPQIMTEAAALGAGFINDVRALTREGALAAAVSTGLPVCLMHMQGTPQTMQNAPDYQNIAFQVMEYLKARMDAFLAAGGSGEKLILDPGFGFGKTDTHNLNLLKSLARFTELGPPLLVGLSRKSMIGRMLNRDLDDRLAASLALALAAVNRGAAIVRVHDVQATADVLKIMQLVGAR